MRILSFLLATLAITNVYAQDSFCTKYAKIVFGKDNNSLNATDEYNLISAVVGRVVVGCDNNDANQFGIPGVAGGPFAAYGKSKCQTGPTKVNGLVADANNAAFFTGTAANYGSVTDLQKLNDDANIKFNTSFPSIRFVAVSGQDVKPFPATTGTFNNGTLIKQGLVQHLVAFFGRDLGCRNLSVIGPYLGSGDMKAVHKGMNITKTVWGEFVTTFATTLLSFGVAQADIDATIKPYVQGFLLGSAQQICNDPLSCDCAPVNGVPQTNVNGVCTPPATPAPTGTPTPKSGATMISSSMATIIAIGAVLLAFL